MAKDEISTRILHEMEHIELGDRHSPQTLLRMLYGALRRKQLEANIDSDPGVSLRKALARTQREYPYFVADFDTAFFGVAATTLSAGHGAGDAFRVAREPGLRPRRIGVTA
jgi:hypothetical protein